MSSVVDLRRPIPAALSDALCDVDALYLDAAEGADLEELRSIYVAGDGFTDEQLSRAHQLVHVYEQRLEEDVQTIGPTLTPDELDRLPRIPPERLRGDDLRRALVAFEIAMRRSPGVKFADISRVLYPVVVEQHHRPQARAPRARRAVRRSRAAATRGRSNDDPHEQPRDLARGRAAAA